MFRWLSAKLENQASVAKRMEFIDEELRHALKNLSLMILAQCWAEIPEGVEREEDLMMRRLLYFVEKGYADPAEIPQIFHDMDIDDEADLPLLLQRIHLLFERSVCG